MADWENGCYYSYDKQYEVNQLEIFYKMYAKVRNVVCHKTECEPISSMFWHEVELEI